VVKKYELRIDLKAAIKTELLELTNCTSLFYEGSFAEIKRVYDSYARKTDCPFIDFFIFHKMLPFSLDLSRTIFDSYTEGDRIHSFHSGYVNVFELICMLVMTSHNVYRKKLQSMGHFT
jgi:hypothetical protein